MEQKRFVRIKVMGNTWEIKVWKQIEWKNMEWDYEPFWQGESWLSAMWYLIKAKRQGHGCVTLHWR